MLPKNVKKRHGTNWTTHSGSRLLLRMDDWSERVFSSESEEIKQSWTRTYTKSGEWSLCYLEWAVHQGLVQVYNHA